MISQIPNIRHQTLLFYYDKMDSFQFITSIDIFEEPTYELTKVTYKSCLLIIEMRYNTHFRTLDH